MTLNFYNGRGTIYHLHETEMSTSISTKGITVAIKTINQETYFSLTDIAKYKNQEFPADVIKNWLRNKNTIEFLGIWESLYNPHFKLVEFDQFKNEAGYNAFVLSPQKWIDSTDAIGLITKSGRYGGGTFAHKDIAIEFASWISVEFRLYLVKEFQRLKEEEQKKLSLERNVTRILSKVNYKIHTDAIKDNLIPKELTKAEILIVYSSEADMLNKVLFGKTANERKSENIDKYGNIRDYATIEQLVVLSNMESINALLIDKGITQQKRIETLSKTAISQMKALTNNKSLQKLIQK